MKTILLTTFSLFLTLLTKAQGQYCKTKTVFGTPFNYELKSYLDETKNRVFDKDEKYDELNPKPIEINSDEFKKISDSIRASLTQNYSKRISDSCKILKIRKIFGEPENENELNYRAVIQIRINSSIQYKFGLDFNKNFGLLHGKLPSIPDSKFFSQFISCCKAIQVAKEDKIDPLKSVTDIDILHVPFPHEKFSDKSTTIVWLIRYQDNKADKNGYIKIFDKYIDIFTGKILKRSVTKVPSGPQIIG
ncbi:hypothetical protein [Lacibacter sp.]|uniref:hypothetical protein n=1 Tax=Lacibacter sp. TaxID=1915409 RepID=UPI002B4ACB22|nr:hypothetical protein [Lacibacter sp.]HLP36754.1 hypothetical protein [Lacibacter sp.]